MGPLNCFIDSRSGREDVWLMRVVDFSARWRSVEMTRGEVGVGELVISSGGAAGVEKSASTRRGTVRPDNVPSEVLEHAAGHDTALKCSLGRVGGGGRHGRQRPRAPLAGRGARVPAIQHEGRLPIRGNQGGVAGEEQLPRVLVAPGDIDGGAGVHV